MTNDKNIFRLIELATHNQHALTKYICAFNDKPQLSLYTYPNTKDPFGCPSNSELDNFKLQLGNL